MEWTGEIRSTDIASANFFPRLRTSFAAGSWKSGGETTRKNSAGNESRQSDVLHIVEGHPEATIIGDLAKGDALPSDTFDCFICTQTLQYIPDVDAAINTIYRILKPGGAVLATIPWTPYNNPQLDPWGYFSTFTPSYAEREFRTIFPAKTSRSAAMVTSWS